MDSLAFKIESNLVHESNYTLSYLFKVYNFTQESDLDDIKW
jgi:hypothetical protein